MNNPPKFKLGDWVHKIKGSRWRGVVVGTYSTTLTPEGYAVESYYEPGSVQIYPASALSLWLDAKFQLNNMTPQPTETQLKAESRSRRMEGIKL